MRLLERHAEPLAQRALVRGPAHAEHGDVASGRIEKALEDLDRRGLPCPVRAEEPEALARAHIEIEPVHGERLRVVALHETAAADGELHAGSISTRAAASDARDDAAAAPAAAAEA